MGQRELGGALELRELSCRRVAVGDKYDKARDVVINNDETSGQA